MIAKTKERIAISLDKEILKKIDEKCELYKINRSDYISIVCSSADIQVNFGSNLPNQEENN